MYYVIKDKEDYFIGTDENGFSDWCPFQCLAMRFASRDIPEKIAQEYGCRVVKVVPIA